MLKSTPNSVAGRALRSRILAAVLAAPLLAGAVTAADAAYILRIPGGFTAPAVAPAVAAALALADPAAVSFGTSDIGVAAPLATVTLLNPGPGIATFTGAAGISGTDASAFSISSSTCDSVTLQPGGTCAITVGFTPFAAGGLTAALTIGSTQGTIAVPLTGSGAVAACASGPASCATWNPSALGTGVTLANSNLTQIKAGGSWSIARATVGMSTGRWYWEIRIDTLGLDRRVAVGAAQGSSPLDSTYSPGYWNSTTTDLAAPLPRYVQSPQSSYTPYGETYVAGDTVSVLFDADSHTLRFYRNCADMGPTGGTLPAGTYYPFVTSAGTAATPTRTTANFGQQPFQCGVPAGYNAGVWQ